MSENLPLASGGEFILYQTEDGRSRAEVRLEDETAWLSQKLMAELFQKDVRTISKHIRNIFSEGELQRDSVVRDFRTTAADGKPSPGPWMRTSRGPQSRSSRPSQRLRGQKEVRAMNPA